LPVTPWTIEAMRYEQKMESTLVGGDPFGNFQNFYGALPSKDREFAQYFMNEQDPKLQKKILDLVPENQRRYYAAHFGEQQPEKPANPEGEMEDYFTSHYLPGPNWEGWRPDVDLNSVKLKVVKNEGLDMSEFNMWPNDEREAQGAPVINNLNKPNMNPFSLQVAIENVLNGAGLSNIKVSFMQTPGDGVDVDFDVEHDRSEEIQQYMIDNFANLMN
jgi:hypothetical protein